MSEQVPTTTEAMSVPVRIEEIERVEDGFRYLGRRITLDLADMGLDTSWYYDDFDSDDSDDPTNTKIVLRLGKKIRIGSNRGPARYEYAKDSHPAFYCKVCGWSENPANPWQVRASDEAFHAPCPAPPDDPGLAETPYVSPFSGMSDEPPF